MNVQEFLARLIRFVIITLGTCAVALAGTTDPDTPDAKYVEFGQQFPNVVRLRARVKCQNPECPVKEHDQFGSAVIIRPHWILTAAHVVKDAHASAVLRDDGKEHELPHVLVYRDFKDGTKQSLPAGDLALGYTPHEFKMAFYPALYRDQDELGKAITFAGFGFPGTFRTGFDIQRGDRKRRAGHNKIDAMSTDMLFCSPSSGRDRFPLEFMITPGDSGGGMFIGNKLAGINSSLTADEGQPTDGSYGDESVFTRVSMYADWVEEQIQLHELALTARATTGPRIEAK